MLRPCVSVMKKNFPEPRTPPTELPADENNSDEPLEIIFAEELSTQNPAEQDAVTTQPSSVPSAEPAPQGGDQPTH